MVRIENGAQVLCCAGGNCGAHVWLVSLGGEDFGEK